MSAELEFYFDFSSPYAYFAATRIDALAARHDRTVRWLPVLLPAIFKVTGNVPSPMVPIKGDYILRDFERTARHHGIAYRKPEHFPILTVTPGRAMTWIAAAHGPAQAAEFARRVFSAYYTAGADIRELVVLSAIAAGLDIAPAALEAGIQSDEVKEAFRLASETALQRGVFGAPFVLADGEPFWGFDRFEQLESHLRGA